MQEVINERKKYATRIRRGGGGQDQRPTNHMESLYRLIDRSQLGCLDLDVSQHRKEE